MGIYNPPASGSGSGDMLKSTYDSNNDGKVNSADSADAVSWTNVSDKPSEFPAEAHGHSISDVSGLVTALTDLSSEINTKQNIPTGTPDGTKYLRDDNTWQTITGGSGLQQFQIRKILRR